jgi:hypothetical protein
MGYDNTLTTDQFCIRQIIGKKLEYNGTDSTSVVFDFKNVCDSGEKYCTVFSLNSGMILKLVKLAEMCLNQSTFF